MATYHFDIEHAQRWGVNEAIFLGNLIYWIRKNKAEGRNLHEDDNGQVRTWTFSTIAALAQLYPFWSARQVRYAIESLKKQEVILTGHFSTHAFDRTLWFALVDESLLQLEDRPQLPSQNQPSTPDSRFDKFVKSRGQKRQMHLTKSPNAFDENATSLKDTDNRNKYTETDISLNVDVRAEDKEAKEPPEPQRSTLNDSGSGINAVRDRAVAEVVALTGDENSRRRFQQLWEVAERNQSLDAWKAALRATQRRLRGNSKQGLERPGAYFDTICIKELEKREVFVPTSAEKQAEGSVGDIIRQGLFGEDSGKLPEPLHEKPASLPERQERRAEHVPPPASKTPEQLDAELALLEREGGAALAEFEGFVIAQRESYYAELTGMGATAKNRLLAAFDHPEKRRSLYKAWASRGIAGREPESNEMKRPC